MSTTSYAKHRASVEGSRRTNGQFGHWHADAVDMDCGMSPWQEKFATCDYIPHDPGELGVQDRLLLLDGGREHDKDQWGHDLSRGGFYRNAMGAPYVRDPSGAVTAKGTPKFLLYGTASGATVSTNQQALMNWQQRTLMSAYRDPQFAAWADEQMSLIQEPRIVVGPRGGVKEEYDDPDYSERNVMDRIKKEAEIVSGMHERAEVGTAIHWALAKAGAGEDFRHGAPVFSDLGLDQSNIYKACAEVKARKELLGMRTIAQEMPVANHTHKKAGTFDQLVELEHDLTFTDRQGQQQTIPAGERLIMDFKTGREWNDRAGNPSYRDSYCGQLYAYASADGLYDSVHGETLGWPDGKAPNRRWGVIFQMDQDSVTDGEPRLRVEVLDLDLGRAHVEASQHVKDTERAAAVSSVYL